MKMQKLLVSIVLLALTGCAQWRDMTPKQRWAVVATGVVIAGAAASQDDDGSAIAVPSPWKPWQPPAQCAPAKCP